MSIIFVVKISYINPDSFLFCLYCFNIPLLYCFQETFGYMSWDLHIGILNLSLGWTPYWPLDPLGHYFSNISSSNWWNCFLVIRWWVHTSVDTSQGFPWLLKVVGLLILHTLRMKVVISIVILRNLFHSLLLLFLFPLFRCLCCLIILLLILGCVHYLLLIALLLLDLLMSYFSY